MPKELQMSVLIASSNEKFDQVLLSLLPSNEYGHVEVVTSAGAARRKLNNQSFDCGYCRRDRYRSAAFPRCRDL